MLDWIAAARRALPALARRDAEPRAHQFVLPRRRPGDAQRALPDRRELGVEVAYDDRSRRSRHREWHVPVGHVQQRQRSCRLPARRRLASTLVAAAGGFEANIEWMKQYWGEAAENFLIRGTPNNRGTVLKLLLDKGVGEVGDPTQCHAVAIDARAPKYDGGIITRLDCVVFGIVVNKNAAALLRRRRGRLAEALRDLGPPGRRPARPDRLHHLRCVVARDVHAVAVSRRSARGTIRELAPRTRRSMPRRLETTVTDFNAAVRPGTFDHTVLDDCRTEGLAPPQDALGAPHRNPALLCLSGAARHHLHLSRDAREQGSAHADEGRQRRPPTCSPPARSWPATCSAAAMPPASA